MLLHYIGRSTSAYILHNHPALRHLSECVGSGLETTALDGGSQRLLLLLVRCRAVKWLLGVAAAGDWRMMVMMLVMRCR